MIRAPLLAVLEHAGVFRTHSQGGSGLDNEMQTDEVSIRIMSGVEEEELSVNTVVDGGGGGDDDQVDDGEMSLGSSNNNINNNRYDIQNVAQWIEQILPFSLLLLVVLIRQHLQVTAETKLNSGERKFLVLISISMIFMLHVVFVYWWYQNDDLMYPLVLIPPKSVPLFWHALFIILVNDSMARQAAMAFKCLLLMHYKNTGGHNYRKQGQMLTLVEYTLLLYRTLLPTPVWYQFFLNKDDGSIFSSVTTGLYLTFKFTSVIQKVRLLVAALRALSCKELHYGSSASTEQLEIFVQFVRKNCGHQSSYGVNTYFVKSVYQNGLIGRGHVRYVEHL
ncbi:hypothetical protein M8C21_021732 [Ambrosia artemisiifolia]|uniref:Uncharacterized protein n=1 Tax=Ambrosia artemisiifolia TaxID=4212 RepID=A0AAD5CK14_AMBAR|nr:hypothetical protein M8C21_021732 [Ambrosia artemisiifolia]